ncbi:Tol-Pal system beta propeller repeat protein TolB [Parasulfitobacter algicola]|uniref:Tol-Pal system protein TolB n=1 Tax=Parasulfitobacter algicola TaxID=2614809 RepID=A0ABX2IVB5_9RHOB|nr:Tol-Pal system beta propeller repeat protein TolB [Sulfitobacter algicola]NSX54216.1 Tol-Pal system protein TolB [Sulfitobacter algicola]
MRFILSLIMTLFLFIPVASAAEPLKLRLDNPLVEPMPFATPDFQPETAAANEYAVRIARVVASDLTGTGLFREIPPQAYISNVSSFASPVQYSDWRAVNAQALITGAVSVDAGGRLVVKFRLFDIFSGAEMGDGLQFAGSTDAWRRMAHKVSDAVYQRITGESGYFDSRVVFVSETGPKENRAKRLAIMDYDGANIQYLTDSSSIVLAPRFSPTGDRVLYTGYETGFPRIYLLDVSNVGRRALAMPEGTMSFAPRFAPDGRTVVFSLTTGGNTDIYRMDLNSGSLSRLTNSPAIETAPSFSPDGSQIVFESDRSGTQQLYIMSANGGEPQRISFEDGRYGTPVWSPRGDLIAFTKQAGGRFHIGVMNVDGSRERLLTSNFLDEGPTWSPNGRVIMFTRETQGVNGAPSLYSVDISGRNLRSIRTDNAASDPSWGPLQP